MISVTSAFLFAGDHEILNKDGGATTNGLFDGHDVNHDTMDDRRG